MTGYQSKKTAARDKVEQWDTPSEAFNDWWDGEYDDSANPFTKHSLAYWAFAGWQAALAQPAQEPVACIYKGYLYMAHEFQSGQMPVDSQPLYTTPPQRPLVDLTDADWKEIEDMPDTFDQGVAWCLARLKERNA
jgi:hypothetical protein